MPYPGRSTVIIFVACAVAVGGAALYAYGGSGSGQSAQQNRNQIALSGNNNSMLNATGTADESWRAQFPYATTSQYAGKPTANAPTGPTTVTEALGMDFLSRFADLKQANLLNNTDIVNQTVDNMLSTDLNPAKPKTYSESDLIVAMSTNTTSLGAFSDALANLIDSYAATTSEVEILQVFTTNNDPSILYELRPIIAEQKRIIAGILAIPVPQTLVNDDVNLLNGMSTLEAASESLYAADTDAVRGLVGSSLHADGAQAVSDALSAIYQALESSGVQFGLHWEILNPLLN